MKGFVHVLFEICTPQGRGGERGECKMKTNNTKPFITEDPAPLYITFYRAFDKHVFITLFICQLLFCLPFVIVANAPPPDAVGNPCPSAETTK